jgi:hypothetical protein
MTPKLELYNRAPAPPDSSPAPTSDPPKSLPPPLPESARRISSVRAIADAVFAEVMIERLAAGDYEGVVMAASALLEHQPNNTDALDCAQIARSELTKVYAARLGSMQRVPRMVMSPEGLVALSLDFGAGFLLSRVDGTHSIATIVETCGLPKLEALRILSELFLRRAIG